MKKPKLPPPLQFRPVTDRPKPGMSCTPEALEAYSFLPNAAALPDNQIKTHSRKRKDVPEARPATSDRPSHDDTLSAGQSQPKRMHFTKEEQYLSGGLPHLPTAAVAQAERQQDTQDITQAAAADALTASPELGQLAPPEHHVELLPPGHEPQQNTPHELLAQKGAKPDRRDMLAAVLGIQTPADRMAMQGPPEPPVAQKLNPNNAAFDPVFAAKYRNRRAQEDPHYLHFQAQKRQLKLQGRLHWVQKSAFTAEEHGYLLDLGDHILQGKDKAKFDSLKARMQNEQQEYLKKLRSKAFADHSRYTGCHEQAAEQIEAELAAQRRTVHSHPRMWQLLDVISLLPAAVKKTRDPPLMYRGTFSRQGSAATFAMPEPLTPIPLEPRCMPSLPPPPANARAVSEAKPSTADHPSAHIATSAWLHTAPATTNTHHPSTAAAEPQNPAQADNDAPNNISTQQGSAFRPTNSLEQAQRPSNIGKHPHRQASYLTQRKAPLQHDPIVQNSAACQEADLILTEGAYECLTATGMTPSYRGSWEIPFTVQRKLRQVSADPRAPSDFERHQQQVLLDMPLPKRLLTLREKHEMLYQHAICQMGCSLNSQLHPEAGCEAGGEAGTVAGTVAGHGEVEQQEGWEQELTDDDRVRPRSPSLGWAGTPFGSPSRDLSYSPNRDMPYSPSHDMPYSLSHDMPYSPSHDANNLVHSMTGLTDNSSLLPAQQPQPTANNNPSEPEPTPSDRQHGASTSNASLPGAASFAQAPAFQSGSTPLGESQMPTTQPGSLIGSVAQEKDQLLTETHWAASAELLPAALPAVVSDGPWSAMDIDADGALPDCAADNAQGAGAQGRAAAQFAQSASAVSEGAADASKPSGGHAVYTEASNLPGSSAQRGEADNAQHSEAGRADNAQHGTAGKADSAQYGEAGLSYRSYRLGGYSVVARAATPLTVPSRPHSKSAAPGGPFPGHPKVRPAVLGAKMEYLEEFGFELLQADELSRWWAAASLPPPGSCDVVVAKVGVHSSHLLDIQCIPSKWVRAECHKSGLDIDRPFRVIRLLMRHLQSLPDGQYMLAHQAGASAVTCFRAAPDGLLDGQMVVSEPLPLGPLGLRKTCLYDLHAAHGTSGATDTTQDSFVGAWQQADPDIDQVPFTFPPVHGPSKLGKGKKARIGAFRNRGPRPNGNQYARDKQRGRGFMVHEADAKLLPCLPKPPKERNLKYMKGKQRDARSGVLPAEYAKALDQEL